MESIILETGQGGQPAINGLGQHSKLIGTVFLISALTMATFFIYFFLLCLADIYLGKLKVRRNSTEVMAALEIVTC